MPTGRDLVQTYASMLTIRRLEEKLGQLVALGVVAETGALATGKEAVAVAIAGAAEPAETIVSTLCDQALLLARSVPVADVIDGLVRGRGVDGLGGGCNLRMMLRPEQALEAAIEIAKKGAPVFCWVQADSEALPSLAGSLERHSVSSLPVVLVVDAPSADACAALEQAEILSERVDGIDAGRMAAVCDAAAERARQGQGATLILAKTERFQGHSATPRPGQKDRPREQTDPLARCRARLIEDRLIGDAALKALEKEIREQISAAASDARDRVDAG